MRSAPRVFTRSLARSVRQGYNTTSKKDLAIGFFWQICMERKFDRSPEERRRIVEFAWEEAESFWLNWAGKLMADLSLPEKGRSRVSFAIGNDNIPLTNTSGQLRRGLDLKQLDEGVGGVIISRVGHVRFFPLDLVQVLRQDEVIDIFLRFHSHVLSRNKWAPVVATHAVLAGGKMREMSQVIHQHSRVPEKARRSYRVVREREGFKFFSDERQVGISTESMVRAVQNIRYFGRARPARHLLQEGVA